MMRRVNEMLPLTTEQLTESSQDEQSDSDDAADIDVANSISKYHHKTMDESEPSQSSKAKKLARLCLVDDPLFAASLDRTQTTSRQAMHILTPALMAAGVDVSEITLCRSSLDTARRDSRIIIAKAIREHFHPDVPLVAHFDGKMLPNRDCEKSDRLPIVVTGEGIIKLLGIPQIPSGTGKMGNGYHPHCMAVRV